MVISATDRSTLESAVAAMRERAEPVGSMHALWDVIFTAEALLRGERDAHKPYANPAEAIDEIAKAAGSR